MKSLIKIILTGLFPVLLWSQTTSNLPGAFTDISLGVRPLGLGGAFSAVSDDPNTAYWNPAGLLNLKHPGVSLMYTRHFDLIPVYFLSFADRLSENQGYGAALGYNGDDLYNEFFFKASYTYRVGQFLPDIFNALDAGIGMQYRHVGFGNNPDGGIGQISGSAGGFSTDLGLFWKINKRYNLSVVWRDQFDYLKWNSSASDLNYSNSYTEDIPAALQFGFALHPDKKTILALEYRQSVHADTRDRLFIGFERELFRFLKPRAGISQNLFSDGDRLNRHITLGLGIEPKFSKSTLGLAFNFAYQFTDINPTLRFGIDFGWNVPSDLPMPPRAVLVAEPDTIAPGDSVRIKWLARDANEIYIEPGIGRVDTLGLIWVQPEESVTFKLTAVGPGGNSTYRSTVTVLEPVLKPELYVRLEPDTILAGQSARLSWRSKNLLSLVLDDVGTLNLNDSLSVAPKISQTFRFHAVATTGEIDTTVHLGVSQQIAQPERHFVLPAITFASGSAVLSRESYFALDELIRQLMAWPGIKLEIRGYTDSSGRRSSNVKLSQRRAESVRDYLVQRGISSKRLIARGFGPDNPVATNKTVQGRAQNRRIEFERID